MTAAIDHRQAHAAGPTRRHRHPVRFLTAWLGLLWALLAPAWPACAYETDPFTNRLVPLQDSGPVLNREVNRAISEVVAHWTGPPSPSRMVDAIYFRIGGIYWVDHLEAWAVESPEVEKLPTPRHGSFYRDLPLRASRVSGVFGIGPSFRLGQTLVGTDKIGHFLSQGRKFWRRWQRTGDFDKAAEHSVFAERAIFGAMTTGTFSNADVVANYEGYLFYRSLFEDDVIPGKSAILRWDRDHWVVQRPFDWNDHVNAYWDEGLNTNDYDRWMTPPVMARLHGYCTEWQSAPQRYAIDPQEEARLAQRYARIGLKLRPELRLAAICSETATAGAGH